MENYLFSVTSFKVHEKDMRSGQASLILGQNNLPQFTSFWSLHRYSSAGWIMCEKKAIHKNLIIYTKWSRISSYVSGFTWTKYLISQGVFLLEHTLIATVLFFLWSLRPTNQTRQKIFLHHHLLPKNSACPLLTLVYPSLIFNLDNADFSNADKVCQCWWVECHEMKIIKSTLAFQVCCTAKY